MAQRTAPSGEAGAPANPRAHHRHRPSNVVVLVAASVTIVALAVLVVPRLRSQDDAAPDRSVDTYTVRLGDTISSVAQLHATTSAAIQEANGLTEASSLDPESQIVVPLPVSTGRGLPTDLAGNGDLLALRETFTTMADAHDVPAALLEADAWQESSWNQDLVGPDGAIGIAQLTPQIVDFVNDELVDGPPLDPSDATDNIELMAIYVDYLLTETDGSWAATLAAYRLGLSASLAGTWDTDTTNYITAAMTLVPDFQAN